MRAAVIVAFDPVDLCTPGPGGVRRFDTERGLGIGGTGADVVVVGAAPGPQTRIFADTSGALVVEDVATRARTRPVDASPLQVADVGFVLHRAMPDPLERVRRVGDWTTIDEEEPRTRRRAFRRTDRGFEHALLCALRPTRGGEGGPVGPVLDEVVDGRTVHVAYDVPAGIPALELFARVADPELGAWFATRYAWLHSPALVVVGWDGTTFAAPTSTPDVDEVTRLNTVLHAFLPPDDLTALAAAGHDVALLRDAHSYDLFDAVILGSEVEGALAQLTERTRPFDEDTLGALVRGAFAAEHEAHRELMEQIETLDDEGVAWLHRRAARRG